MAEYIEKIEKVIAGLECCTNRGAYSCDTCPYNDGGECVDSLNVMQDALEVLREVANG